MKLVYFVLSSRVFFLSFNTVLLEAFSFAPRVSILVFSRNMSIVRYARFILYKKQ